MTTLRRKPFRLRLTHLILAASSLLLGLEPTEASNESDVAEFMAQYVQAHVEANDFTGAVLAARGSKPLFRRAYGMADLEHGVPNRPETKFRLGSISKQFNALLIMMLHEAGDLNVEDRVCDHLAGLPAAWEEIQLIHLVTHRSGIPDIEDLPRYDEVVTLPTRPLKTMEIFRDEPLQFPPGSKFSYSSSGYVLLAAVVEAITGEPFEDVLKERVLDPLQLKNTGHDQHETILPHRARGYAWGTRGLQNATYINMDLPIGGGELYSTVDDLLAWVKVLEHCPLLKETSREALFVPNRIKNPQAQKSVQTIAGVDVTDGGYAYGWFVGKQHGRPCRQHGGAINGFTAYLAHFPEDDFTVIVLCNSEIYFSVLKMGIDLAAILFNEAYEIPQRREVTVDREILARYRGEYEARPGVSIFITQEESQLSARFPGIETQPIYPSSETEFFFKTSTYRITFAPDEKGAVTHLTFHLDEKREVRAKRKD